MKAKAFFRLAVLAMTASLAWAGSPGKLQQELSRGAKVTIIDVRSTELYQLSHIPGAINIPAALCGAKKLPPLGRVVVYDGGIGDNSAGAALIALNAKPGITAENLEGGFAAWEAQRLPDTKGRGTADPALPLITYQQLKTNDTDDIVLVDLRKMQPSSTKAKPAAKSAPLTDLPSVFPRTRVASSPFGINGGKKSADGGTVAPLLVLIDKGDGAAEEMAHALRANGVTRFVILAGGEEIIARQGRSGSKRSGSSAPVFTPTTTISN